MGKTTVASLFQKYNVPVWNADENVHRIYQKGASGYEALTNKFPKLSNDFGINRDQLTQMILKNEISFDILEAIVHPLLSREREKFILRNDHRPLIVFEIPLLFETKADLWLDAVLLVTCSKTNQISRLKKRTGFTKRKLDLLMSKQQKNTTQKEKATFVVNTDKTLTEIEKEVKKVMLAIEDGSNGKRSSS